MGSGDDGGVAEETLILGVLCACLHRGGHVAHVTGDDHHALTTHTAGQTKLADGDLGGLDGDIGGLDGGSGGIGLDDAQRTLVLTGLGAEQSGDDLLVDAADDGGIDHAIVKAALDVLHSGGDVGDGARQNDLVLAGAGGMSLHQTDARALQRGVGSLDALGNALQFNNTNSLIHSLYTCSFCFTRE